MDLSSLYIGLLILALIALPFFLLTVIRKKRETLLQKQFIAKGIKYGIEIKETDQWKDRQIGMDSIKLKVLFTHFINEEITETLIDLKNIQSCGVETIWLKNDSASSAFDTIKINFKSKSGLDISSLSIFESEIDSIAYFELQIAEKWVKLINELLK